jgi:hypothetical protein
MESELCFQIEEVELFYRFDNLIILVGKSKILED